MISLMLRILALLIVLGTPGPIPVGAPLDLVPVFPPTPRAAHLDAMVSDTAAFGARPAEGAPMSAKAYPAWRWPLDGPRRVSVPYRAPAHRYAPGHRGVDLAADPGTTVRAPADGVVAFRGVVVDRPLLTIEHDGGYVSTYEPVTSSLAPGDRVAAGDVIGVVGLGGHAASGTIHMGVRLRGEYINPLLLFDDVPRAVLLLCCAVPSG